MSFDSFAIKTRGSCRGLKGALPPADLLPKSRSRWQPPVLFALWKGRADAIPKLYFWGVAPNPTLAVWQEGKACCLSLCEGSVSLRSVKGRVVFSAKISTLKPLTALSLYVSKNVEIYRLTGQSPLLFLGEAGGAGGNAPCKDSKPPRNQCRRSGRYNRQTEKGSRCFSFYCSLFRRSRWTAQRWAVKGNMEYRRPPERSRICRESPLTDRQTERTYYAGTYALGRGVGVSPTNGDGVQYPIDI